MKLTIFFWLMGLLKCPISTFNCRICPFLHMLGLSPSLHLFPPWNLGIIRIEHYEYNSFYLSMAPSYTAAWPRKVKIRFGYHSTVGPGSQWSIVHFVNCIIVLLFSWINYLKFYSCISIKCSEYRFLVAISTTVQIKGVLDHHWNPGLILWS